MKKLILLLLPVVALANPIDDKCPQFVSNGAPVSNRANTLYLCKQNYAVNYRVDTKTAEYVVEHPTIASIKGPAKRQDNFHVDTALSKQNQSTLGDYNGSGYDRGHLVPAGDNTTNAAIMSESFVLSNMVPQQSENNRFGWEHVETGVRNLVLAKHDVYVSSGTIYNASFKTIGVDKVGVPDFIWKVVYDRTANKTIAFILPNIAVYAKDLPKYVVSVTEVEKQTGLNFLPLLPNATNIESVTSNLKDWPVFN